VRGEYEWFSEAPGDTEGSRAKRLSDRCAEAHQANSERRGYFHACEWVYSGNTTSLPLTAGDLEWPDRVDRDNDKPFIRNTPRAIVNARVSKLSALDDSYPVCESTGGDFAQRRKARAINRLCFALYSSPMAGFANAHQMFRHGHNLAERSTGNAAVFAWDFDGRVYLELDNTLSLGFDRLTTYGKLLGVVRTVYYEAHALAEIFPKRRTEIIEAAEPCLELLLDEEGKGYQRQLVAVCQGWRFATPNGPGYRMFCLRKSEVILDDSTYTWESPPFAMFKCQPGQDFDFGEPSIRYLYEAALAENDVLQETRTSVKESPHSMTAIRKDLLEEDCQVTETSTNQVIRCSGPIDEAIRQISNPLLHPDAVAFANLMQTCQHETLGIDSADTAARGSPNATSGRHQAFNSKIFTEVNAAMQRDLIAWKCTDAPRAILQAYASASKDNAELTVTYRRGAETKELTVADLDLDGVDKFVLTFAAVSEEAVSPQQRRDEAQELYENGRISAETWIQQRQTYDLLEAQNKATASNRWLDKQIELWLDADDDELNQPGIVQSPQKYLGANKLTELLSQCAEAQMQAYMDKVPENRLALFRRFMDITTALIRSFPPPMPPSPEMAQ
jgi:hypothetical protein